MTEADLIALFEYFGLDLEDDIYILKRRIKELRNQKEIAPSKTSNLRKFQFIAFYFYIAKVPKTLKEEKAAKKKTYKSLIDDE